MGKSLLIRLLVQHWRASGKRVLICAASAKAETVLDETVELARRPQLALCSACMGEPGRGTENRIRATHDSCGAPL